MTPERAAYHRLMLLSGLQEEYLRELDTALETEDPITAPILDLAFCTSDLTQTISILYNYTLDYDIDEIQLCDMILDGMRRRYLEKSLSPEQIAQLLYSIVRFTGDWFQPHWYDLCIPSYDYELVEEGRISPETFYMAFEAYILRGERVDVWDLEKEAKKKKFLPDFFRKRNRKEHLP